MATLTAKGAARTANKITQAAADVAGDDFVTTGAEAVLIENGSASPITVTVVTPATVDGLAVADREIIIPAGEMHLCGPWPRGVYGDANHKVSLTYSDVTSLTVAVLRI